MTGQRVSFILRTGGMENFGLVLRQSAYFRDTLEVIALSPFAKVLQVYNVRKTRITGIED